jgi:hypothetical protein
MRRQLSYDGAEFQLSMIDLDKMFQLQYSRSAAMWQLLEKVGSQTAVFAKKGNRGISTVFWGAHQRFFKNMLMAAKVPALAKEAREAICNGYSVVIGLQSTGEAAQKHEAETQGMVSLCLAALCATIRCILCELFCGMQVLVAPIELVTCASS